MIKIAGIIILILTGILGGYTASSKYSQKVNLLREYIKLIHFIKTEIRYSAKPLSEILHNHPCAEPLSSYLRNCLIIKEKEHYFSKAWKEAFCRCSKENGLSKEEENIIVNFGAGLGTSDTIGQLNHCDYNLKLIEPYLSTALEDKKKKEKLPIILGTCLSLIISLLFI